MRIYEPLALAGKESLQQTSHALAYAQGLARWRDRDFAGARECFSRVAGSDPAAALFARRAAALAERPPGADWEPVNTLEGK